MRHLFRFLLNERIRSDDPAAILSGPKRGRGLPKVLSIADVDRLLVRAKALAKRRKLWRSSGFARCGYIACWKCFMPRLAGIGTGGVARSASRRDARMIVVRGKGNKERLVPLNEASRQAMADYLAAMEALKPEKKKNAGKPRNGCFPRSARADI